VIGLERDKFVASAVVSRNKIAGGKILLAYKEKGFKFFLFSRLSRNILLLISTKPQRNFVDYFAAFPSIEVLEMDTCFLF
jgi:hypothetical protein